MSATNGIPGPAAAAIAAGSSWVDEIVDAYVEWSLECVAVRDAYRRWARAPRSAAAAAFAAYQRAVDDEEEAAEFFASLLPRRAPAP
jgi:hypothetical protein